MSTILIWIRQLFAAPVFEDDEDKTRTAGLLNTIVLTTLALSVVFAIVIVTISPQSVINLMVVGILILLQLGTPFLMRSGRVQFASIWLTSVLWVIVTLGVLAAGGVRSSGFSTYILIIVIAGLLLGGRAGIGLAGLSVIAGFGVFYAEASDILPPPLMPPTSVSTWLVQTIHFVLMAELLYLATRSINETLGRARCNERALAKVNEGLQREVTERKQAEEELRGEKEFSESILNAVVDTVFVFDPNTGKPLRWNKAFNEISGYTDEEIASKKAPDDWYSEEDLKRAEATTEKVFQEGLGTVEMSLITKDERLIPTEYTASVIKGAEGKPQYIIAVGRDITERKRAEEALKEYSERLEEMVNERTNELRDAQEELVRKEKLVVLGRLAGGIAHELRNPLGTIKNASYFLNMVMEEPEPEVKEVLEILEKEVETSERIISNLLDFARAKSPIRRKVDINDVVQEALSHTPVPQSIKVVNQLDEALPTILADPDQLAQVFGNIILNAMQAMPESGRLVVKTSEVFRKPSRSREVTISFTDTGLGIPEENLEEIFEPLFTTKAKGIGLGLALAKTLVEGHGGTIEIESEVEKGSTFTVKLPIGGKPALPVPSVVEGSRVEGEKSQHGGESQHPDRR
jgi:PAS domain S-box-containing protein